MCSILNLVGASNVIVTDRNIEMAQCNKDVNSDLLQNRSISVVPYSWGEPLPDPLTTKFDLILGADIIYIEDTYPFLLDSLGLLSTIDTVILLASKHRYDKTEKFLLLSEKLFDHTVIHNDGTVSIYKLKKRYNMT